MKWRLEGCSVATMPADEKAKESEGEKRVREYEAYKQAVLAKPVGQLTGAEMKWRLEGCSVATMPGTVLPVVTPVEESGTLVTVDQLEGSGAIKRAKLERVFVLSASKVEEVNKPRPKGKGKGKGKKGKAKGGEDGAKGKGGDKQSGQNFYLGQKGQRGVLTCRVFGDDVARLNMQGDSKSKEIANPPAGIH